MNWKALLTLLGVIGLLACTKETESTISFNLPRPTVHPDSLDAGMAQLATTGTVQLFSESASASWVSSGYSFGFRSNLLEIRDTSHNIVVQMMLYYLNDDPATDIAPLGNYPISHSSPEQGTNASRLATIFIYDYKTELNPWHASPLTTGEVKINSHTSGILSGTFEAIAVGAVFEPNPHYYNIRGSFKAVKK